jgi:hypothetical protein
MHPPLYSEVAALDRVLRSFRVGSMFSSKRFQTGPNREQVSIGAPGLTFSLLKMVA